MQAYLNHFQRPPSNKLVTRKLESENKYDEDAWSDSHWEDTISKRTELKNTTNHSSPIFTTGSDYSFVKEIPATTINPTQSASKFVLDYSLQDVTQCNKVYGDEEIENINKDMKYKDLKSNDESEQNKSGAQNLKNSDTKKLTLSQEYFAIVSKGAKPSKLKERIRYLNVSNRFTMLEIEPCFDYFDDENFDEDESFKKPANINKCIKKKNKKMKTQSNSMLQHSKLMDDFI